MKVAFKIAEVEGENKVSFRVGGEKLSIDEASHVGLINNAVRENIGFDYSKESDFAIRHKLDEKQLGKFVKYLGKNNIEFEVSDVSELSTKLDAAFEQFKASIDNTMQAVGGTGFAGAIGRQGRKTKKPNTNLRSV